MTTSFGIGQEATAGSGEGAPDGSFPIWAYKSGRRRTKVTVMALGADHDDDGGGGGVGAGGGGGGGDRVWSVVVVDDEEDVRRLVQLTLQFDDELQVVATARSADEALGMLEDVAPDLVVLDHLLGGPVTGLQVAGRLRAALPATRVILFSAADTVIDLRDSNVDAVVSKMDLGSLPDVARRVLVNERTPSGGAERN